MKSSQFSAYYVTKHSWKGKYHRLFLIGTQFVQTLNPANLQVTNEWPYEELVDICPSPGQQYEITVLAKRKDQNVRFSCSSRAELLTDVCQRWNRQEDGNEIKCEKLTWQNKWAPRLCRVTRHSIVIKLEDSDRPASVYNFTDIVQLYCREESLCLATKVADLVRLHLFRFRCSADRHSVCQLVCDNCSRYIGYRPGLQNLDVDIYNYFVANRFSGNYNNDVSLTSLQEFAVFRRHKQRILCLTTSALIERDPLSYRVTSLLPYSAIHMIHRSLEDDREFHLLIALTASGATKHYSSTNRDDVLVSLMDSVRSAGNLDVYVQSQMLERGFRFSPLHEPVDAEIQVNLLKGLERPTQRALKLFCANVNYHTGSAAFDDQTKLILVALCGVLRSDPQEGYEACLAVLKRLLAIPVGCEHFSRNQQIREGLGNLVKQSIEQNSAIAYAAVEALNMLMQPSAQQADSSGQDLLREQRNKRYLLQSERFVGSLLDLLAKHVKAGTSRLLVMSILDFFTLSVCAPFSETTDGVYFDQTLTLLAAKAGYLLYSLIDMRNSITIRRGAAMLIQALIEESNSSMSRQMCELSLVHASFISNMCTALFSSNKSPGLKTSMTSKALMRKLSRNLLNLWTSDGRSGPAFELLTRCIPMGLLQYLLQANQYPPAGYKDYDETDEGTDPTERDNLQLLLDDNTGKQRTNMLVEIEDQINRVLSHWRLRFTAFSSRQTTNHYGDDNDIVVLRRRRAKAREQCLNWPLFYYHFYQDHCRPDLIWNFHTRQELKQCLLAEYERFRSEVDRASNEVIAWNHREFSVPYVCLSGELRVGNYYLRLLTGVQEPSQQLPMENFADAFIEPAEFFSQLYHRFLLTPARSQIRYATLRALALVYSRCYSTVGPFNDVGFVVSRLKQNSCGDKKERDLLVEFLDALSLNEKNASALLNAGAANVLTEILPLAHLHTDRPRLVGVATTDMIQFSADCEDELGAQWFFLDANGEKTGPVTPSALQNAYKEGLITRRTQIWAAGMHAWRPFERVGQFYWTFLVNEIAKEYDDEDDDQDFRIECDIPWLIKNETDLAVAILKILRRLCAYFPSRNERDAVLKPAPKIISSLSAANNLSTLVHLFLTFDPAITESVALLLCSIFTDNPTTCRLYETGAFFFLLMYQGSNLLPIARLLHQTHKVQATRVTQAPGRSCSILSSMLPEALVYYLDNHGPEKFSQAFVSECRNPEVIWNTALRRHLVQRLAVHLSDFTNRLRNNIYAPFRYCPIPCIEYPEPLKNQLFCNRFYLNELILHKDWPISDPFQLLKDCLRRWRQEMEVKTPDLSLDGACSVLELEIDLSDMNALRDPHLPRRIRQAYFKLAQKYHPDKNPGVDRGKFEKVSEAYELLMDHLEHDRSEANQADIHERNLLVLLKSQVYIYQRFGKELSSYRYAGYDLLVELLRKYMDNGHCDLFSLALRNQAATLPTAIELCVVTVRCSPLNAEAFRSYPDAIHLLSSYYSRCSAVLSESSKGSDLSSRVCLHVADFWQVAGRFEGCRRLMPERLPDEMYHVARVSRQAEMSKLLLSTMRACESLATRDDCMAFLPDNCKLWLELLKSLFNYDVTFKPFDDNDGVESDQMMVNATALSATTILFDRHFQEAILDLLPLSGAFENQEDFLVAFHSNTRSPLYIWNELCRQELLAFLNKNPDSPEDFSGYSVLALEPRVNGVYLKPFVEQPDSLPQAEQRLLPGIFAWIDDNKSDPELLTIGLNVLELIAVRHELDLDDDHVALLCDLMTDRQEDICRLLKIFCRYEGCIQTLSESSIPDSIVRAVVTAQEPQVLIALMQVLSAMIGIDNVALVKRLHLLRAHLHIAHAFCSRDVLNMDVRNEAASLLQRLLADALTGPRLRIELSRYIPDLILESLGEPMAAVRLFDSDHDNPEFCWSAKVRAKVVELLNKERFDGPQLAENGQAAVYEQEEDSLCVLGVRVEAFLKTPGYQVRFPKKFSNALLERLAVVIENNPDEKTIQLLTEALMTVWQDNQHLLDGLPATGFITLLCRLVNSEQKILYSSSFKLLTAAAQSVQCQSAFFELKETLLSGITAVMKSEPSLRADGADAILELVSSQQCGAPFTEEAIRTGLAELMLEILCKSEQSPDVQTNARLVAAIKQMLRVCPGRMDELCKMYPRWAQEYEQQSHDLFIDRLALPSDRRQLLLGSSNVFSGYLMDQHRNDSDAPPPVDQVDYS